MMERLGGSSRNILRSVLKNEMDRSRCMKGGIGVIHTSASILAGGATSENVSLNTVPSRVLPASNDDVNSSKHWNTNDKNKDGQINERQTKRDLSCIPSTW